MPTTLRDRITQGPMLCDGGMGTQLMAAGLPVGHPGVLWNVENPDAVAQVHRRYLDAGCELVTTNTFQATRTTLEHHGLAERTGELNRAAAQLARRAADGRGYVLADVGPFGGFLEPMGDTTVEQLLDIFTEALAAQREGGADGVIIETMSDATELATAVRAARALGDWPIFATCAFQKAGERIVTMMGTTPAEAVATALDAGADVVGANCGTALTADDYVRLAEQLVAAARGKPVIVQPNAGLPIEENGVTRFPATPEEMTRTARALRDAGVHVIGGCCGTTPAHLAAMRAAVALPSP